MDFCDYFLTRVTEYQKLITRNHFHECYDIFKDGLSGFGWNDSLNMWKAEPKVWEPLIAVNYHPFMSLILNYIIISVI